MAKFAADLIGISMVEPDMFLQMQESGVEYSPNGRL